MSTDPQRYDDLLRLADAFAQAGDELHARARLSEDILTDPRVTDSAALSPRTWATAEESIAATAHEDGLLERSVELETDALALRATVRTYRWIDELQAAAYERLGTIAGRAISYLAPQVELGGAIVAGGLIEIEALERDDVAAYLGELALSHPELMEHVTTGGALSESLQVRGLLTSPALSDNAAAQRRGLQAIGVEPVETGFGAAVRDAAAGVSEEDEPTVAAITEGAPLPGLAGLFDALHETSGLVAVRRIGEDRAVVLLPHGTEAADAPPRLVSGDPRSDTIAERLRAALDGADLRLLVVGAGVGGAAALALARSGDFRVEQVVTASSPATQVHGAPTEVPVLSFDRRSDPVALLGSLLSSRDAERLTVLYDGASAPDLVSAGSAADAADHPALAELTGRLRILGYLA